MKKFLIVLLIIISISCQQKKKKSSTEVVSQNNFTVLQVEPKGFIKGLPKELSENSGIIIYDDLFWTFNDSGGKNILYAFNFKGEIEKEIEVEDAKNLDWEDIAQDKKHIYIGNFGNNSGTRKNLSVLKIKKSKINKKKKQKIKSKEIEFKYKNQNDFSFTRISTAFDCEAMIEYNKQLYIFTKDWSDRTTTVYKIPSNKGKYEISPIENYDAKGLITGADISPDKTKLALIGYKDYKPILWIFSDFSSESFFDGKNTYIEMDSIFDAQTEGICFLGNDSVVISCERSNTFQEQLFIIDLTKLELNGEHYSK